VQLPEIAVIEKPADHVRRDLARAIRVKLVPRRKLETAISAGQRSFETRMEKAVGLDHDHAGSATVRMAAGQPKELRGIGLARHTRSIGRRASTFNGRQNPGPL
jgi:hypothetical protein